LAKAKTAFFLNRFSHFLTKRKKILYFIRNLFSQIRKLKSEPVSGKKKTESTFKFPYRRITNIYRHRRIVLCVAIKSASFRIIIAPPPPPILHTLTGGVQTTAGYRKQSRIWENQLTLEIASQFAFEFQCAFDILVRIRKFLA